MTEVNPPPQLRIPDALRADKQTFGFMTQLQRIVWQLWERTGGTDDSVSTIEIGELYEPGLQIIDPDAVDEELNDFAFNDTLGQINDLIERVDALEYEATINDGEACVSNPYPEDFDLEVARGNIPGVSGVNKYGECPDNVDSGVDTDIWDGASAAIANLIWDAPTAARIHDIVSDNVADTSAGAGARTIQVYGLTSWSTAETSEVITMNGTTSVSTVNSYVIIHRMKVLTKGASGPNVGTISATAQTDTTVTAYILPSEGQTQMAIYGIPSGKTLYLTGIHRGVQRAVSSSVNVTLLFNPEPDTELTGFLDKGTYPIQSDGLTAGGVKFKPYVPFPGPGILKLQGNASANDSDVAAQFDGYLVDD